MKNNILKGSILVALGAASYGMLATFVKLAYREGFSTAEVTLSQFGLGFAGLLVITLAGKKKAATEVRKSSFKDILKLIISGTAMGLTSIFYYKAVQYVPVSVGIVLLMQSVWMGVFLEMILRRQVPRPGMIISVFIVLAGTILATNLFHEAGSINRVGFGWGILAAVSYTATIYSSNNISLHLPAQKRSLYTVLGGLITILLIFHSALTRQFSFDIFLSWGLLLSLFGTILPPLLFMKGLPLTGVGTGAIIASIEIPVSVLMAHIILNERVSGVQWGGVVLILLAVVLMNTSDRNNKLPA